MDQGVGWVTPIPATKPLTGFSHGAAGMAWALLELTTITGEERFRTTALAAITYERSLFSPEAGNWRDNREPMANKGQEPFMTVWRHGAQGLDWLVCVVSRTLMMPKSVQKSTQPSRPP